MIESPADKLRRAVLALCPDAEFDENPYGELIIKTGMHEDLNGILHEVDF